MPEKILHTRNTSRQIVFITCCLFAIIHASEGNSKYNCERCSQEKMKTDSSETNIKMYPSHTRFVRSHENFLLHGETISPKSNEEYLKNSQVKYANHLEPNTLHGENLKHHKRSVRSALHKKYKRSIQHAKTSYPFLNLAGRGRRESTVKGRLKRNAIDSKRKDDSLSEGPMRISLLIDGLPPSPKDTRKRETNGVKGKTARSGGSKRHPQTFRSKENFIPGDHGVPAKVSGEGKGLLSAKEIAAAGSLDLAKYVEEAQQPHVNIRTKRVYDILDKLFPSRRKRKVQPENFGSASYDPGARKPVADDMEDGEKDKGTLPLPMFGYSYNRVEDDSAHNARFLFV